MIVLSQAIPKVQIRGNINSFISDSYSLFKDWGAEKLNLGLVIQ